MRDNFVGIPEDAIGQQIEFLHDILGQRPLFLEVLQRARRLGLPGWYLAAGCVAHTVWNVLGSRPPDEGIRDYDLPYFEPNDLSRGAEDMASTPGGSRPHDRAR